MSRTTRTAVTAAALAVVLATATPALAHVEVDADDPRALAENVTLDFLAESESGTAGITELQVYLPEGITPDDVTYADGPDGWDLTPGEDNIAVAGPAIPAGEDAEFAITVRQLPDAESLVFKTLQTYDDGRIDRWIELEGSHAAGGVGNEAPRLELEPAAPGATPITPSPTEDTAAPTTSTPAPDASPDTETPVPQEPEETEAAQEDDSSPVLPLTLGALALVLAAAGALWWWRRRSADRS